MMNERLARYPADQKHFLHWVCGFVLQLLHVWRTTKLHQRHVTLEICISTKPCSHFSQQECHCVIFLDDLLLSIIKVHCAIVSTDPAFSQARMSQTTFYIHAPLKVYILDKMNSSTSTIIFLYIYSSY